MIYFYFLYIFIVFLQCHYYSLGFYVNYHSYDMNLDCRDNQDVSVDWWYVYKPPKKSGRNLDFTFITSKQSGRFIPSRTYLNHNSLLQFTLAPLYKKTLKQSIAVMSYGEWFSTIDDSDIQASTAAGILFGNSFGGIWISHTLPGFPNLTMRGSPLISDKDYKQGHMIMCLTLNVETLNKIAAIVRHTESKITMFSLPNSLSLSLPDWTRIGTDTKLSETTKTKLLRFSTRNKTLRGKILARGPDDSRYLYKTFAELQGIVLDVYNSNRNYTKPICQKSYSLRYIEKISIKIPQEQVCYINRMKDKMSFGVSTGAVWQRSSLNSNQHWTCTGNHDRQGYLTKGGLITCVDDYSIWFGFDNLKTKEPEC